MKCKNCGKEFESKRTDAKFCSDACRKADKRGIISDKKEIKSDKMSEIIPNMSEINVRDNVTDKVSVSKPELMSEMVEKGPDWMTNKRMALYVSQCCNITFEEAEKFF